MENNDHTRQISINERSKEEYFLRIKNKFEAMSCVIVHCHVM